MSALLTGTLLTSGAAPPVPPIPPLLCAALRWRWRHTCHVSGLCRGGWRSRSPLCYLPSDGHSPVLKTLQAPSRSCAQPPRSCSPDGNLLSIGVPPPGLSFGAKGVKQCPNRKLTVSPCFEPGGLLGLPDLGVGVPHGAWEWGWGHGSGPITANSWGNVP